MGKTTKGLKEKWKGGRWKREGRRRSKWKERQRKEGEVDRLAEIGEEG